MKFNTTKAADIRRFIDFNRLSSIAFNYEIDGEHNADVDYAAAFASKWIKANKRKVRGLLHSYKNKPLRFFNAVHALDLSELESGNRKLIFTNVLCVAFDKFLTPVRTAPQLKIYHITSFQHLGNTGPISEPSEYLEEVILGEKDNESLIGCKLAASSEEHAKSEFYKLWPFTKRIANIEMTNEKFTPKPKATASVITGELISFSFIDDLVDEFCKLHWH